MVITLSCVGGCPVDFPSRFASTMRLLGLVNEWTRSPRFICRPVTNVGQRLNFSTRSGSLELSDVQMMTLPKLQSAYRIALSEKLTKRLKIYTLIQFVQIPIKRRILYVIPRRTKKFSQFCVVIFGNPLSAVPLTISPTRCSGAFNV